VSAGRYEWMTDALCAQADPDAWTETGPGCGGRKPKRICERCPVRIECGAHADLLEATEGAMPGIWGGASKQQRKIARQQTAA
jgi:WhiB family transcriptional regulator, redox-sensing transcriptional regulator